nr:hypothetical protein [Tanacetum cinerariifolium]
DLRVLPVGLGAGAHGLVRERCRKGLGTVEVYGVKLGTMGQ